ncbi:MAG: hypothetical protein AAF513_04850 [Pseudomonadota bacterium]
MTTTPETLTPSQLTRVSETLYANLLADDALSEFFTGYDVEAIRLRQARFLEYVLRLSEQDLARFATSEAAQALRAVHAPLLAKGLNHEHFDQLLHLLDDALLDAQVSAPLRQRVHLAVEATRGVIMGETYTQDLHFKEKTMFARVITMTYAVACYAIGMATLVYAALWMGNIWLPNALDAPATHMPWALALLINLGLVGLFAVQHSVMARPWFKAWLTRLIAPAAERATYILASSVAMFVMMYAWQPLGGMVWSSSGPATLAIYGIYAIGWMILVAATFMLNHFDLFGLRQAWLNLRGKAYTHVPFATPLLYRFVRHPIYVGWLLVVWAAPVMSAAHLLFALLMTLYIIFAIPLEERDLEKILPEYAAYKATTPALIPGTRRAALREVQSA